MHTLANCVKALQGMTSNARNSLAAQDLQRIIAATQAHIQTQPDHFEDTATPPATPNMQRVPWKRLHHGGDVCGIIVLGSTVLSVLYRRFFVPAGTLIVVTWSTETKAWNDGNAEEEQ